LSFDWNKIGADTDFAYLSLWSDDESYRFNDWVYEGPEAVGASDIEFCARVYQSDPSICAFFNLYDYETGWQSRSLYVGQAGWYTIGFGTGSAVDESAPTILALDNLRFDVPTPGSPVLVATALALLGLGTRRGRRFSGGRGLAPG
jgi:hypothetical protein